VVTEIVMMKMARHVRKVTGQRNLCLAGGVALNCVANGKILRERIFDDIWIQPAAGDAGGALGCALSAWHHYLDKERIPFPARRRGADHAAPAPVGVGAEAAAAYATPHDRQRGSYLGPEFSDEEIVSFLDQVGAKYERLSEEEIISRAADVLAAENVVGWFQGRMEFGPRALGNRSIIGDSRSRQMQTTMNLKIKFRESFRPFAPSVLEEHISDWFEIDRPSPYMLLVADVREEHRLPLPPGTENLFGIDKLKVIRSTVPSITHVDYSARIQSVSKDTNPRYHALISAFYERTGCPVIVNTSFNVRGEPIVCTPKDAYTCFMRTDMDYLVLGNYILAKPDQPPLRDDIDWKTEFQLD
jgi:carbamoyltransferase